MRRNGKKRSKINFFSFVDKSSLKDSLKEYLWLYKIKVTPTQLDVVEKVCIREWHKDNFWPFIYDLPNQFGPDEKITDKI